MLINRNNQYHRTRERDIHSPQDIQFAVIPIKISSIQSNYVYLIDTVFDK